MLEAKRMELNLPSNLDRIQKIHFGEIILQLQGERKCKTEFVRNLEDLMVMCKVQFWDSLR